MIDGGFDNPKGKFAKNLETEKPPKDLIIPLLNRTILQAVKTMEDENVKIDGVSCSNFICVG